MYFYYTNICILMKILFLKGFTKKVAILLVSPSYLDCFKKRFFAVFIKESILAFEHFYPTMTRFKPSHPLRRFKTFLIIQSP